MELTNTLRLEYLRLFKSMEIRPQRYGEVDWCVRKALAGKSNYQQVELLTYVPWFIVAAIHCLEASFNFGRHLHNGDLLSGRTTHVPKGRPQNGNPPFTWSVSAIDALEYDGLAAWTDWSLSGCLFTMERFNGFGYRKSHPDVLSPYLWSFSNQYSAGGYTSDHSWSSNYVSDQCGAAVLLRRLSELGEVQIPDDLLPAPLSTQISWGNTVPSLGVFNLQRYLNSFPQFHLRVDGIAGPRTKAAFVEYLRQENLSHQ